MFFCSLSDTAYFKEEFLDVAAATTSSGCGIFEMMCITPLTTAIGRPFLAINRQPLELESCSNPLQIQQVF